MDLHYLIEIFGYFASATVALSVMLKTLIKLRLVNMVGAFLLVIYCFIINSYPLAFLNLFIALVNLYFILQYYKQKEYFRLVPFQKNSAYLLEFLNFYKKDIQKYFPEFEKHYNEDLDCFYILRNMIPACVFVIKKNEDNTAEVLLDYVITEYRDAKIGHFIFNENNKFFVSMDINKFYFKNPNKKHLNYLDAVGFVEKDKDSGVYEKEISKIW